MTEPTPQGKPVSGRGKITLLAENLYVIRSTRTRPDGSRVIRYYETPAIWNTSPTKATVFQSFESGVAHLIIYRKHRVVAWADGSMEVLDVVPLYGEILNSPNGVTIEARRDGETRR